MFPIPLTTGLAGPGTPPPDPDEATLDYLPMPKTMATYQPPRLPAAEDLSACGPALAVLERLLRALAAHRVADPPVVIDLSDLDAANRTLLEQTLGDGEVSARISGPRAARIQETRLAGVWWVQAVGPQGTVTPNQHLEIAELPGLIRAEAFRAAPPAAPIPDHWPAGVMNAPGVLVEVNAQADRYRPGGLPHVVNLTLLPQTEQDLRCLDQVLGTGPVTLLSRGYGSCRVSAARVENLWWVQHFNSEDRLILNTIEVIAAPTAVLAAQEDIDDSAARLADILEALRCA
jgi:hydrogenase-1 operon protein HyaF